MRFTSDPSIVEEVQWFLCQPFALDFPTWHRFGSSDNWDPNPELSLGDYQFPHRQWDRGKPPALLLGDHYCGPLSFFQQGVDLSATNPPPTPLKIGAFGIPSCCNPFGLPPFRMQLNPGTGGRPRDRLDVEVSFKGRSSRPLLGVSVFLKRGALSLVRCNISLALRRPATVRKGLALSYATKAIASKAASPFVGVGLLALGFRPTALTLSATLSAARSQRADMGLSLALSALSLRLAHLRLALDLQPGIPHVTSQAVSLRLSRHTLQIARGALTLSASLSAARSQRGDMGVSLALSGLMVRPANLRVLLDVQEQSMQPATAAVSLELTQHTPRISHSAVSLELSQHNPRVAHPAVSLVLQAAGHSTGPTVQTPCCPGTDIPTVLVAEFHYVGGPHQWPGSVTLVYEASSSVWRWAGSVGTFSGKVWFWCGGGYWQYHADLDSDQTWQYTWQSFDCAALFPLITPTLSGSGSWEDFWASVHP